MSEQQEVRLGQQLGEYRLVHKLGGGGFGIVYLAEHVHEHTQAAVKVLDIRLTKSEDFKEFINEARTIRLHHPNIVSLLDFGISRDDLPFLVMEYAPQGTLRDRHPKGERVPLSTIVSYVDQLASALQYAHDHRVIHRDIKPENVLVRADGTLLVSDFGIAKFLEQSLLTSMHKLVGTPTYMSPEQQKGKPCFASDQYALAVVIYEWICGVRPFQGTVFSLAVQHMNTPPPSLREHLPSLPEEVERVVFKALAKAPEDRFGSIQEFAEALREAVQPPIVLSPSIETINTARLEPAMQAAEVPVSHHRSTPAFRSPLPETPGNAASSSPQKRPLGSRSSLLKGGSLGLILLLIVLVVTLIGGGTYYIGVNNSAGQLSNVHILIDQANAELTQNPIDALQQLALAQKTLLSAQGPFLVGDQVAQYNTLGGNLRQTLQKAVAAYNQKELVTQLSCTINQSVTLSGKVQPVSLSTMHDEKGTAYQYVLATDDNLYRLDEQNHLKDPRPFSNNAHVLSLTGNGQHLFALTSQSGQSATTYSLSMFSYDTPPTLKEEPIAVEGNLIKEGWIPTFLTAYGTDVSLILIENKAPHRTMLLSYDAANWQNGPQKVQTALAPDIVSVTAFPNKRLFFLTSDGHIKSLTYGDGAAHLEEVSLQNPVSPPLANDGTNFTISTPIATPVPQSTQVGTSVQPGVVLLTSGTVGENPHLYVVDNPNHRIMDLKFVPGQSVDVPGTTPISTPTSSSGAGALNPSSLKLVQQFASLTLLGAVKSATIGSDGKELYLLTQGGSMLITISAIDRASPC